MLWKRKQKETSLKNLIRIAKGASKFKYDSNSEISYRCGRRKVSSETLSAKHDGNELSVRWQWTGEMEEGKGLKDDCLCSVEGSKDRKPWKCYFLGYEISEEERDKERQMLTSLGFAQLAANIRYEVDKKANKLIRQIASIARAKYTSRLEEKI